MQNVVVIEHRRKSKFRAWVLQQSGILLYQNIFDSIASKSSIDLLVLSYDVPLKLLDSKQSISKMIQNHLISWLNSIPGVLRGQWLTENGVRHTFREQLWHQIE